MADQLTTQTTRARTRARTNVGQRTTPGGRSARLRNRGLTAGATNNPHYLKGVQRGFQMAFAALTGGQIPGGGSHR